MQNVLFLCTGNSARSILSEALLRHWADGMLTAFSAGSHPADEPHAMALEVLEARDIPIHGLRSKSWDEYANAHAPVMDLVITVCDTVANEVCPVLPGAPLLLHWGLPDPASAQGDEAAVREAFSTVCDKLEKAHRAVGHHPLRRPRPGKHPGRPRRHRHRRRHRRRGRYRRSVTSISRA